MLRVMKPLHDLGPDPIESRRRLLADLVRLVGAQAGLDKEFRRPSGSMPSPSLDGAGRLTPGNGHANGGVRRDVDPVLDEAISHAQLSPRMEQTLRCLLGGDSEKQIAARLELSRHTIHVYVKNLYRRFGVSSRGELMARWVRR